MAELRTASVLPVDRVASTVHVAHRCDLVHTLHVFRVDPRPHGELCAGQLQPLPSHTLAIVQLSKKVLALAALHTLVEFGSPNHRFLAREIDTH